MKCVQYLLVSGIGREVVKQVRLGAVPIAP